MSRTYIARMVVETIVEADDQYSAKEVARARFEALGSDDIRVCSRITDPHLGSPMTEGMTIGESMRSRMARRKAAER